MKHIIVSLALGLASGVYAEEASTMKDAETHRKDELPDESAGESNAG